VENIPRSEDEVEFSLTSSGKKPVKRRSTGWEYLGYAGQVGFSVAVPIGAGVVIGNYLDGRYGSYPKGILTGLVLGAILSGIGFVSLVAEMVRRK